MNIRTRGVQAGWSIGKSPESASKMYGAGMERIRLTAPGAPPTIFIRRVNFTRGA